MLGDEVEGVDNGADGQADALYRTTAPLRSDSDTIMANRNNVSHFFFFFETFVWDLVLYSGHGRAVLA